MANNNYEEQILKAIQLVVDDTIKKADFDRTIEATVLKCVDKTIGKYLIQYQDSTFYAYSNNIENTYGKGALVYILVPNNDMAKHKTILGSTEKLGPDYISIVEERDKYQPIGKNCINTKKEFDLYSFKPKQIKILYDKIKNIDLIDLDESSLKKYITQADSLICGANILTQLPPQQRFRGDYGIVFTLNFKDNENGKLIQRQYKLNVDAMKGNPYNFNEKTSQYKIFSIDGKNFDSVENIYIYEQDFPLKGDIRDIEKPTGPFDEDNVMKTLNSIMGTSVEKEPDISINNETFNILNKTIGEKVPYQSEESKDKEVYSILNKIMGGINETPYSEEQSVQDETYHILRQVLGYGSDIFISDIELVPASRVKEEELNGCHLIFNTEKGTIFEKGETDDSFRTIEALVKIKGEIIDKESQLLKYYWFRENNKINSKSERYNLYGGKGWECLNGFNLVESENGNQEPVVEWTSGPSTYITMKKDNIARETKYKCVAVYNNDTVVGKEIVIYNYGSKYETEVNSTNGINFSYDIGQTTLICEVKSEGQVIENFSEYSFIWAKNDSHNNFDVIQETVEKNGIYESTLRSYNELKKDIENENILESDYPQLKEYEKILKEFETITRVDKNKIHNLKAREISNFATYSCSVYRKDTFIGTASIKITNSLKSEKEYSLVINNGNQIFKYNEAGVSPASKEKKNPQVILPITFSLYDNDGTEIDHIAIEQKNVQWKLKKGLSMIKPSANNIKDIEEKDGYIYYKNVYDFIFTIADSYDFKKMQNDIEVIVKYKDKTLRASTNLIFLKEGNNGTNGTDFLCRIIPNIDMERENAPRYPIVTYNTSSQLVKLNFNPKDNKCWFAVEFLNNGKEIFSGTEDGITIEKEPISLKWSILKNDKDGTNFKVGEKTGFIEFIPNGINNPVNILKCEISYNRAKYFATIPIILVKENTELYSIEVPENTGFNEVVYASDGTQPLFDMTSPFEIKVFQNTEKGKEDISNKDTNKDWIVDYEWYSIGQDFLGQNGMNHMSSGDKGKQTLIEETLKNKKLDRNKKYYRPIEIHDGYNLENGILCIIRKQGSEIGRVHIPVHFYLNRYGHSALNDWDGNGIKINEDDGIILAPQIGAGRKDENNRFTGMVMGDVGFAKGNTLTKETGLFAYQGGQRTIALDAETGSAKFGMTGQGQIVIDPGEKSAIIESGDFSREKRRGMRIDLSNSTIEYGNGRFKVDQSGKLTAEGFATIGAMEDFEDKVNNTVDELGNIVQKIESGKDQIGGGNLVKDSALKSGDIKGGLWQNGLGIIPQVGLDGWTKKIVNNNKQLQSLSVYENDDSRGSTISKTFIEQSTNFNKKNPFDLPQVICTTNEIRLSEFEENLSLGIKIKNSIKTGLIQIGFLFYNDTLDNLGFLLDNTLPIFEKTVTYNPDQMKELTSLKMNVKIPKENDLKPAHVGLNEPKDKTIPWIQTDAYDIYNNVLKTYDGNKWIIDEKERGTFFDIDSTGKELWVYKSYTKKYFKCKYKKSEFKAVSAVVVFSILPAFERIRFENVPKEEWVEGLYYGIPGSGNIIKRVRKIGEEELSLEETDIFVDDVINNTVPTTLYPSKNIIPPTGYYNFGDLMVSYSSFNNIWQPYPEEIYGKKARLDGNGLTIKNENKTMYIDENEILAKSGDKKIFTINENGGYVNNLDTQKLYIEEQNPIGEIQENNAYVFEQRNGLLLLY